MYQIQDADIPENVDNMPTLEVSASPQGFRALFFQLIYYVRNAGTFRIPLKDQLDDPSILMGGHFTIYLVIAKQAIASHMMDNSVCADLMDFILEQGNFGHKKSDDKAAKVMSRYRTPLAFVKGMQRKGLNEWELARKYPVLRPFAWTYSLRQGSSLYLRKGGLRQFQEDRTENQRRTEMFGRLYGEEFFSRQISMPHATPTASAKARTSFKQWLRPLYKEISRLYMEEEKRIYEYRESCKNELFQLFSKWFYDLWD